MGKKRSRRFINLALAVLLTALLASTQAMAGSFDDGGLLRVINRWETLPKDYVPEEMVLPEVDTNKAGQKESIYMVPCAAAALEEMFSAAEEDGYTLLAVSGYRSYSTQSLLFKNKVDSVGSRERAQKTVAPPGASEHQSGLAMDVVSNNYRYLNRDFLNTPEGKWVAQNCCYFGFIVRYKDGWTNVTGCNPEPWHIRYIGIEHAVAVTRLDIPYETYAAKVRTLPEYVLSWGTSELFYGLVGDMLRGDESNADELRLAEERDEDFRWETLNRITALYAAVE